ncbi:universal stress protein [Pseudomonas sp.]|uniref:universal stress protein n=1 Tax=Pseudomonas sp. TaxID=306 RepID=UPI0028B0514E|nr:universal stress protein [Pseudomonas sp.]
MPRPALIAIDASPASHAIVELAERYCRPSEQALRVLLVVDPSFAVHGAPSDYTEQERDQYPAACEEQQLAERAVAHAVDALRAAGFDCEGRTVPGDPVEVILDTARALDCELIVMGHRHLSRLGRLLDPSVSSKVIDQGQWPVLVAPTSAH